MMRWQSLPSTCRVWLLSRQAPPYPSCLPTVPARATCSYGGALSYKRTLATVPAVAVGASGAAPLSPPAADAPSTQHSLVAGMPTLRILVTNTKVPKETGACRCRGRTPGAAAAVAAAAAPPLAGLCVAPVPDSA